MQRKFFRLFLVVAVLYIVGGSCTKIDTTQIGADLIPAVDNVHTFADTLEVIGTQGVLSTDSTRIAVNELQVLGSINNDPIFGKTTANMYLEFKPVFFPYYFGSSKDTINPVWNSETGFDSLVLCLSYKGFYGDSTIPQHLKVYELAANTSNFKFDSIYQINYQPDQVPTNLIGEDTITPTRLASYVHLRNGDSVNYQVRIPLSQAFLNKILLNSDSSSGKPFNSDSLFKSTFKGFAIEADQGSGSLKPNGLFYISLTDAKTRLEVHYRKKNITPIDTSFSAFAVVSTTSTVVTKSATADYINRDRTGSQYLNPSSGELFIQSTPGTYATLQIPRLSLLDNRIVHRAELIIEQIPPMTPLLPVPSYLYLDAIDTGTTWKYKPLPYDLSPNVYYNPHTNVQPFYPTNGIDHTYFGGTPLTKIDPLTGQLIYYYIFNISRYVQNIVTKHEVNYGLRLTAPYDLYYYGYSLPFSNRLASGGIKVGNGNNPNYKLRLRIVYSKI